MQTYPFRSLLYLEGILLVSMVVTEGVSSPFVPIFRLPLLTICSVLLFGAMGFAFPVAQGWARFSYMAAMFCLVTFASLVGGVRLFPFLQVLVVLRSAFILGLRGQLLTTGLIFLLFLSTLTMRLREVAVLNLPFVRERLGPIIVGFAFIFGLGLVSVLVAARTLLLERKRREELATAHEQVKRYALRVESLATFQERTRIAREIHDSLGHVLTALNVQLEGSLKLWQSNPERAQSFLREAKRLGSAALQEVRQSVSTLRSNPLQQLPLPQAIESLLQDFEKTTGIRPQFRFLGQDPLPNEVSTAIFRIVQEALTNICKYAAATTVRIEIEQDPSWLNLNIMDDGRGFQTEQNTTGFGLQGMRERTAALNGQITIASQPGSGCRISVRIPL